MDWTLIIIIGIVVLLVVFLIGLYNSLVQKRLRIDEAFAQIEVQLKRRHDLIPNLVNAVKGYMGFEQKVLTDVTNARAAAVAAGAQGPAQQASAENALSGTLRSLFAVVENYPEQAADVVRQAVAIGAGAVWLQQGIISPEGRRIAAQANMDYVEDLCTAVERALGRLTKRA